MNSAGIMFTPLQTKPVYADTARRTDVKLKKTEGRSLWCNRRFAHQPEWTLGVARKSSIHIAGDTVDAGEKEDREWREEKKVAFHTKKHRQLHHHLRQSQAMKNQPENWTFEARTYFKLGGDVESANTKLYDTG